MEYPGRNSRRTIPWSSKNGSNPPLRTASWTGRSGTSVLNNPERKEEKMQPMEPRKPRASAKNCPQCNQPLTIRTNQNTKTDFLGCTDWPDCHHTEPLPLDMILRRQGHPELPGL